MAKTHVEVGTNVSYRIHASERSVNPYGTIISRTFLDEFGAVVTTYSKGWVIVESPKIALEFNLRTGQIQARSGAKES